MTKWEYKTLWIEASMKGLFGMKGGYKWEGPFNELGQQGWELINVIGMGGAGGVQQVQAIFKRPIE